MYSTFIDQEIEIINQKKLKSFSESDDEYGLVEVFGEIRKEIHLEINFSAWTDHKIQGYWYDETKNALDKLSKCLKGWVEFEYEEGYHFRIYFEDNDWFVKIAEEIDWNNYNPIKP